ncbi:conserved hypothetical protein [Ricinus communis]|uniref:Uncharacterized protein n=1 Tax=Ricinus communis TaxID=3988 RepID=B9SJY1_RICCO|nr:conserved hypothetical protein [Ricinus communis]
MNKVSFENIVNKGGSITVLDHAAMFGTTNPDTASIGFQEIPIYYICYGPDDACEAIFSMHLLPGSAIEVKKVTTARDRK